MRLRPETCWLLLWLPSLAAQPAGAERWEEEAAAVSVSRCKTLKEMDLIKASLSDCYCYNQNSQVKWKYIWSTVQVKITSSGLLSVVYITERYNCQYPETILSIIKCMIHNFWTPEESNDITIIIHPYGETVCFSVKPARKTFTYTISVKQNIVDFKLFFVFVVGILLFFYAKTLSQQYSTFWALMLGCWFASLYVVGQLMEELKRLWYESRICVLGYVLTLGCVSFAVCYKHGPLVEERSVVLLAWLLRLLSLLLVYAGVSAPQFASTAALLLILASGSRRYLRSALTCVGRKMKKWFTSEKPVVKFLTEDEYREQADAATTCSLEELRQACRSPGFPSWLAVSRLQEPKKFADFVLGGSHLSPEEVRLHEEQYGLGGAFLEEQLFNLRTRDSLPAQ
nr:nuclear envelope integral membrane protein 2-like [Odocoileus virginianus texanus]